MPRFRFTTLALAWVSALALPAVASAQSLTLERYVPAGPAETNHPFSLPVIGVAGSQSATFISVLSVQPNTALSPTAATYLLSVSGSPFVAVPAFGMAPVAVGMPPAAQIQFDSAIANGRAVIRIDHIPPISSAAPQPWVLKLQLAAAAPATCFWGKIAHVQATSQEPKFSLIVGPTFYSNNHCAADTGTPALASASLGFGLTFPVSVNTTRTGTVTVFNSGTADLTLAALPALAAPFSFVPPAPGAIAPNATRDILVTYGPTAVTGITPDSASLSIPGSGGVPPTVAVPLSGHAKNRELVLCIDASNSMNWADDGTPLAGCPVATTHDVTLPLTYDPDSRIRKVRAALQTFKTRLDVYGDQQVHLGVVRFPGADLVCGSSHADALASAPSTWQIIDAPLALYNAGASTLATTITNVTENAFYHSTPMKAGLQESVNRFTAAGGPFRAIVLLSDGFHNVPAGTSPSDSDLMTQLTDPLKPIRVYPLGFGTSGNVDHPLLMSLATSTGGLFFDATGGGDLVHYYNKIFTTFMQLAMAVDPRAEVVQGVRNTHPALVTEYDHLILFTVAWDSPQENLLQFELVAPNGRRIKPDTRELVYREGPRHKSYSLDMRSRRHERHWIGEWKLEVEYPRHERPSPEPRKESYSYDVIMRSDLEMEVKADKTVYYTGDRVVFTAGLAEQGRPMKGKKVLLQARRPSDGMGDFYAANPVSMATIEEGVRDKFGPNSESRIEKISALFKKHYYLTQVKNIAPPPYNPAFPGEGIPMHDDGKDGDLRADDGIYTIALDDLLREAGNYSFFVTATGTTSGKNDFRREFETHLHVQTRVETALVSTTLSVQPISGGGEKPGRKRFRALVTPKDKFGNHLGPGFAREIVIRSSFGRALTNETVDDLNGGYSREFEFDAAGVSPVVEVTVKGEKLPEQLLPGDAAGQPAPGGTSTTLTLVLILAILLAIALILALLKCCRRA